MYNKFFGFKESPFNLAPDPHFFYHSDIHREALARLSYGLQERIGFILISGEIGSGKTTLINALLENIQENIITACINNTRTGVIELLRNILAEFDLETDSWNKSELIKLLNKFLLEKNKAKYNVVLIIDESQNLSLPVLEEVRLLSNLETKKEKLLQVILVGQPELKDTLNRPELKQLSQRITVNYHIEPISKQETVAYVKHRLKVAGSKQGDEFNKKALNRIYSFTKGIPRMINTIADNSLLVAYVSEKKIITEAIVQDAIKDYKEGKTDTKIKKKKKSDPDLTKRIENIELSISQLRENAVSMENKIDSLMEMNQNDHIVPVSSYIDEEMNISNSKPTKDEKDTQTSSIPHEKPPTEISSRDKSSMVIDDIISKTDMMHDTQDFQIIDSNVPLNADKINQKSREFSEKIMNALLYSSIKRKVDSILINPDSSGYKIRIKKGDDELEYFSLPETLGLLIFDRLKSMGNGNFKDFWVEKVLKIKYQSELFHVNVSILPMGLDMRGVLSFQYPIPDKERDFKSFGFPSEFTKSYEKMLSRKSGTILVTGQHNSGKSKFLYTSINRLEPLSRSIISFERKITSRINEICQIELGDIPSHEIPKLPSKMLSQQPDVIVVQQELDSEILEDFLKLSSHRLILLEICSDNLNDLIGKLQRITELNAIYKSIISIVQLRKLKSLCSKCKISYEPRYQLKELVNKVTKIKVEKLYDPKGCEACDFTGYIDYIHIQRMTKNSGRLSRHFKGRNLDDTSLRDLSQDESNKMLRDGFIMLSKGVTSFDEVKKVFL